MAPADTPPPRDIVYSSKHAAQLHDYPIPDIDSDPVFTAIFALSREYTMTGKDAMFALYSAVNYVVAAKIGGDIVECGVWRGGSALLAALTLREAGEERVIHLYDTFEGMTAPTAADVDMHGGEAASYIAEFGDDGKWCYAGEDEVRSVLAAQGFVGPQIKIVKGDVLETLPSHLPQSIAILRLDTDWYESTKLELELLYPRLRPGGVLIIDDYGYWAGSRKAVDEYFLNERKPLLMRVNEQVRLAIKV